MKKAFTLIELIAVIVVLAIILAITVPGITGIVRSSRMKAVESDAKLVLDSIRLKKIEDDTFDPTNLNKTNVSTLLGLSNENYSDLEVKINEGQTYIKITGQGKWSGFSVCGTYFDMQVNEGDCYLDFNLPVITLLGDSFVSINVGQSYSDAGATANDVEDGDITNRIVKTGTVNPSVPGTYIITYNVSDTAGREAVSVTRTIYVIDVEAPVITVLGDNPVNINVGDTYSDAGATALDDADGDVTSRIVTTGTVNPSVVGTYTITYTVSDNAGHESTAVRTINVIDNVLPTVTFSMNGNATYAQSRSTTVTVNDNVGVNASSLKYQWTLSTTAPTEDSFSSTFTSGGVVNSQTGATGIYYLWILAKDNAGNTTIQRTNLFKLDNTPPVISITGSNPITIYQGTAYTDAGATATDANSGVGSVTSTGSVNINAVGTYYIYYNVSDNAGNAATQVTRTVNVIGLALFYSNSYASRFTLNRLIYNGSSWSSGEINSADIRAKDPIDTNTVFASFTSTGTLYRFTYNGSSWAASFIAEYSGLGAAVDANTVFAGIPTTTSPNGLYRYKYNGSSWTYDQVNTNAGNGVSAVDANTVFIGDNGISLYKYNGSSWTSTQVTSGYWVGLQATDANTVFAFNSGNDLYRFTYNGSTWVSSVVRGSNSSKFSAVDANTVFIIADTGYGNGPVHRYTYSGGSWSAIEITMPGTAGEVAALDANNVFAISLGVSDLYHLSYNGSAWSYNKIISYASGIKPTR